MTIKQAYKVLKHHAEWRQGLNNEMLEPAQITKALEVVLAYLENKFTQSNYAAVWRLQRYRFAAWRQEI